MADQLNVWPLTTFYSYDRATLKAGLDEEALAKMPDELEWSDPSRGLDTIRALRERLQAQHEGLDVRVEQALAELNNLESMLLAAQANQARFRIYPGP